MLYNFIWLTLISQGITGYFLIDDFQESRSDVSSENLEDLIDEWLGEGNGRTRCDPTIKCPDQKCYLDPAVIHGYCCGCTSSSGDVSVSCPDNLQCPLREEQLCSDYRYMIDCCCQLPIPAQRKGTNN
ncbi:uncharacterized protein isoform X2 [Rhodnius prolixus]|uniref:uncharacterized protein isoform X2 n=1 Tax=Rhodnius prolixus TaxID=13249 RepID=UPI003D18986A